MVIFFTAALNLGRAEGIAEVLLRKDIAEVTFVLASSKLLAAACMNRFAPFWSTDWPFIRASLNFFVALCGIGLAAFFGTLGELFSWFAASSASSGFSKDFLLLDPFDELDDVESGLGAFVADAGTRFNDSSIDFIILGNAQ